MNIRRFLSKVGDAKFSDLLSVFPMCIALLLSPFYKSKFGNTWAICERRDEARDNGYHFFKFVTNLHPEQKCIYAIERECRDYEKVEKIIKGEEDKLIRFGSVMHWITYFTCEYIISSQSYRPNGYICTFFERAGVFKPQHVFLQHGITINNPEYLHPSMKRLKYFITATPQETEFVSKEIGHGDEVVKLCGFSRFDVLHENRPVKGRIFVMPTWRKWLRFKSEEHEDAKADFQSSEYILMWNKLLSDARLQELIEKKNLDFIFYPHPNMRGLINPQSMVGNGVKVIEGEDIQDLLMSSQLLITDYSSVFFDMVYMKKPVIFYQFDEDKFRKYHYPKGWFDYKKTSFGKCCKRAEEVIDEIIRISEENYKTDTDYAREHERTFPLYDSKNSERIYQLLHGE